MTRGIGTIDEITSTIRKAIAAYMEDCIRLEENIEARCEKRKRRDAS